MSSLRDLTFRRQFRRSVILGNGTAVRFWLAGAYAWLLEEALHGHVADFHPSARFLLHLQDSDRSGSVSWAALAAWRGILSISTFISVPSVHGL